MNATLAYAIRFVADMDAAVRFHTSVLGLRLPFQSPEWSELDTGQTTLALHQASPSNAPGSCQLGYRVDDVDAFCAEVARLGVRVVDPPRDLHGARIARLQDDDGAEFSVSSAVGGHSTQRTR